MIELGGNFDLRALQDFGRHGRGADLIADERRCLVGTLFQERIVWHVPYVGGNACGQVGSHGQAPIFRGTRPVGISVATAPYR